MHQMLWKIFLNMLTVFGFQQIPRFRQVGEKFINKVTASFIEDSYEEFAKKELQECCGTKNAQGLRMGDFS